MPKICFIVTGRQQSRCGSARCLHSGCCRGCAHGTVKAVVFVMEAERARLAEPGVIFLEKKVHNSQSKHVGLGTGSCRRGMVLVQWPCSGQRYREHNEVCRARR